MKDFHTRIPKIAIFSQFFVKMYYIHVTMLQMRHENFIYMGK